MNTLTYIAVYIALFIPAFLFLKVAWNKRNEILGTSDFFPLKRTLTTSQYRATTVAASMSLATVMIYFMNLSAVMGAGLFINVLSFCAGIVLIWFLAPRIMHLNPKNLTIQSFLGERYGSRAIRNTSQLFSLIGYFSIFSVELLVGVKVLTPFFGNYVIIFAFIYLIFLLIYATIGGYKAIVATDRLQLFFICSSIAALAGFLVYYICTHDSTFTFSSYTERVSNTLIPPLPFLVGITLMNLPAPISDAGTWQRICSCTDGKSVRKGLKGVFFYFLILWSALILLGIAFSLTSIPEQVYADKTSLINSVIASMGHQGSILSILFLFVFMTGLFSAMVSTADSILIVASQILMVDLYHEERSKDVSGALKKSRIGLICIGLGSFILFSFFSLLKLNVVDLVFAIYGAQLAMVPIALGALYLTNRFLKSGVLRIGAIIAVTLGFLAAWTVAIYGKTTGNPNLIYIAPLFSLFLSLIVYAVALIIVYFFGRKTETYSE